MCCVRACVRVFSRCRGRTLKVLESTPLQIAMCVLVLLDAGVVVAEILLDMHATRSKFFDRESLAGRRRVKRSHRFAPGGPIVRGKTKCRCFVVDGRVHGSETSYI
jgi:hypothetical protein